MIVCVKGKSYLASIIPTIRFSLLSYLSDTALFNSFTSNACILLAFFAIRQVYLSFFLPRIRDMYSVKCHTRLLLSRRFGISLLPFAKQTNPQTRMRTYCKLLYQSEEEARKFSISFFLSSKEAPLIKSGGLLRYIIIRGARLFILSMFF